MMKWLFPITLAASILAGCGVYTFNGSSLPGHLKTVDIPLFANQSLEPSVAEEITSELTKKVLSTNLLKIVSTGGDASINGTVRSYENKEYYYDITKARTADVTDYIVRIVVDINFADNKKNAPLYKGVITGQGIYKISTEKEVDGRRRAVTDAVDQILQNSVQGW
jgi:hypothetical protein